MTVKDKESKVITGKKIGFRKSFIEWTSKKFLDIALVKSEILKNQVKLKGGLKSP